jgi:uncharacterized protein (TIGR02145 family)
MNKCGLVFLWGVATAGMWFLDCSPTGPKPVYGQLVTDIDGNVYQTVVIGGQTWIAEDLKTTRFNDGTPIPLVTDPTWDSLSTPGYCWYNNDSVTYKRTYGALYNWYAVNTGKLAPSGWHVPTDAEWTMLSTYLGGESVAGGPLKDTGTTYWVFPNAGATNNRGFSALPGGFRGNNGSFFGIGSYGYWWSSTADGTTSSWLRFIYCSNTAVNRNNYSNEYGCSVRCVKDQ